MNKRDTIERQLVPARVLLLIRDGKLTSLSQLRTVLGIGSSSPSPSDLSSFLLDSRLSAILNDLVNAGLVSQKGELFAPTELVARIQNALHLSLTELAKVCELAEPAGPFVESSVIEALMQCAGKKFDLIKVVCFCEELNSSFSSGNYLASTLLIRALINHIPPVFGKTTFQQVVS